MLGKKGQEMTSGTILSIDAKILQTVIRPQPLTHSAFETSRCLSKPATLEPHAARDLSVIERSCASAPV